MSSNGENDEYYVLKTKTHRSEIKREELENPQEVGEVNQQFICDLCGFKANVKIGIIRHLHYCGKMRSKKAKERNKTNIVAKCEWCNVQFGNHGNLTNHVRRAHGLLSYKSLVMGDDFVCHICDKQFVYKYELVYHIRKTHYNMTAKIPYAHKKKVNQVWFENVLNSDTVMEIKKTGHNKLLMKKLNEHTSIKVNNYSDEIIDVSHLYPTGCKRNKKAKCDICGMFILKRCLNKHIAEKHYNQIKHRCNNCNRGFKRMYLYLKHVCKKTKGHGIRMEPGREPDDIHISRIESLAVPSNSK